MLNLKKYLIVFTLLNLTINNKPVEGPNNIGPKKLKDFKRLEKYTLNLVNSFLGTNFTTIQEQFEYVKNENNTEKIPKLPTTPNGEFLINGKSVGRYNSLLYRRRFFFLNNPKYKNIDVETFQIINNLLAFMSRAPFNGEENDNRPLFYGNI